MVSGDERRTRVGREQVCYGFMRMWWLMDAMRLRWGVKDEKMEQRYREMCGL